MTDAAADLFTAIHANNLEGVRLLVQTEPALLGAVSPSGLSPVLFATYYHRPDILRFLIGAGAPLTVFEAAAAGETAWVDTHLQGTPGDVNAVSPDGFSLLGLAAFFGREAVAALVLARGADVNAVSQNAMRVRPLHSAAAGNHAALARTLVQAGADVNAAQHGGFTPLMSAAQNGNTELAEFLLESGADLTPCTPDGQDAAALAHEAGHEELAARLKGKATERQESRNAP